MNEEKPLPPSDPEVEKLLAERVARRARYDELKVKIEENDGALDRKREEINQLHAKYLHGIVDLTFYASNNSFYTRAQVEREALHKLIDQQEALRLDYSRAVDEQNKIVEEANTLSKQIEEDESASPFAGLLGGFLGGTVAHVLAKAGSAAKEKAAKEKAASGGESGGGESP